MRIEKKKKRANPQKRLKKLQSNTISAIMEEFSQSAAHCVKYIHKILIGDIVGHIIKHIWKIDGVKEFVGYVMKLSNPYYQIYHLHDDNLDADCQLNKLSSWC